MKAADLFAVGAGGAPVIRTVTWTAPDGAEHTFDLKVLPRNAGSLIRSQKTLKVDQDGRDYTLSYICAHVLLGEDEQPLPYEQAERMQKSLLDLIADEVGKVHLESAKTEPETEPGN